MQAGKLMRPKLVGISECSRRVRIDDQPCPGQFRRGIPIGDSGEVNEQSAVMGTRTLDSEYALIGISAQLRTGCKSAICVIGSYIDSHFTVDTVCASDTAHD